MEFGISPELLWLLAPSSVPAHEERPEDEATAQKEEGTVVSHV